MREARKDTYELDWPCCKSQCAVSVYKLINIHVINSKGSTARSIIQLFCPRHLTSLVKCTAICSYPNMGTESVHVNTQMKAKMGMKFTKLQLLFALYWAYVGMCIYGT